MGTAVIHITSIVPPEVGWPIMVYCEHCRKTEIILSLWAIKPTDGDYWKINGMCVSDDPAINMAHSMPKLEWPEILS